MLCYLWHFVSTLKRKRPSFHPRLSWIITLCLVSNFESCLIFNWALNLLSSMFLLCVIHFSCTEQDRNRPVLFWYVGQEWLFFQVLYYCWKYCCFCICKLSLLCVHENYFKDAHDWYFERKSIACLLIQACFWTPDECCHLNEWLISFDATVSVIFTHVCTMHTSTYI